MEYLPVFVYSIKDLFSSIDVAAAFASLRCGLIECRVLTEKRFK